MAKRKRVTRKKQSLASKRQDYLRANATPSELVFMKKLKIIGVEFQFQRCFIAGKGFAIADFYLAPSKLVIEVDGGYHLTPDQQRKDGWRDKYLTDVRGLRVVRITNEVACRMTQEEVGKIAGVGVKVDVKPWPILTIGDRVRIVARDRVLKNQYARRRWFVRKIVAGGAWFSKSENGRKMFCITPNRWQIK
jgi:very-short-patch-repair endonuclease